VRVAHAACALRSRDLERVTVDTTAQPKNITFPTDAKLLHAAVKGLVRLAKTLACSCGKTHRRIAKHNAMMAARYAHAKQFKRLHRPAILRLMSRMSRPSRVPQ
jgi:IS5 family transposase